MLQLTAPPLPTLLGAGEDTYNTGQSHPDRNQIGVFDLLIVTRGCLTLGENQQEYQIQEKQAFILYPDRHHFTLNPCTATTHFYWFHFTTANSWIELKEPLQKRAQEYEMSDNQNPFIEHPFSIRLPKLCEIQNWNTAELLCKQILSSEHESTNSWEWKRQILFHQLLQEIANTAQLEHHLPSLAIAERAAAYLRKHYFRKVTYKELGKVLRYHPNHIARCMMNTFGCSPIDYLNGIRLEQAKIQLVSTNMSIEKVAENCGFLQTAYFCRFFKKRAGLSPSEFRQQYIGK